MSISSRTPEGSSSHCPICSNEVKIEPSQPLGDAPCPHCGTLLWFVRMDSETKFFDSKDVRIDNWLSERLGVPPEAIRDGRWRELGIDSLDMVELIMELEEEIEVN